MSCQCRILVLGEAAVDEAHNSYIGKGLGLGFLVVKCPRNLSTMVIILIHA
jgi:hypothetical protein